MSAKDVQLKSAAGNMVVLESVPDPSTKEKLVARLPAAAPDLSAGRYEVFYGAKSTGTFVDVP